MRVDEVEVVEEIIKVVIDDIVGVRFIMRLHKVLPLEMVCVLVAGALNMVSGFMRKSGAHRKYCFHYSTEHGIVKYGCVV